MDDEVHVRFGVKFQKAPEGKKNFYKDDAGWTNQGFSLIFSQYSFKFDLMPV